MQPNDPKPIPASTRRWTSRSVGTRFQHGIFYLLIKLGGRRAALPLLHLVVLYYVLFRPSVRRRRQRYRLCDA